MEHRRAWLLAGPAMLLLLANTAAPPPAQQRALARLIVCPERLKDDPARDLAVRRFLAAYARAAPKARPAEALAFRTRILTAKRCSDRGQTLTVTVPEE